ncbi:MAG TPA: hypothetical protein VFQ13_24060, partial [Anaerolineales bacterium]|nr:hypothetical protein [Anaerolineales bacterium]
MTQNRRYLGMTPQQIAILGGLVVLVCLVFTVAGCFFLQGGANLLAPAPQNTLPPQPTWTPHVLPTLTPTETPTPVAYELLIPQDWVQFKTELVEIWLPKEFKKQKPDPSESAMTTDLMMVRFSSETSLNPMIVMVSYEPMIGGSLDAYVDAFVSDPGEDVLVAEKGKVSVNTVEAIRIVLEMRLEGGDIANDLVYIFQDGSTIWYVQYIAQINEFYAAR